MKIRLGVYGGHNIYNALASIAVALEEGIDIGYIKSALYKFKGIKRRFEEYGTCKGVKIVHDYAHHPTEIRAVINLAKRITQNNLYVVFQTPDMGIDEKELARQISLSGQKAFSFGDYAEMKEYLSGKLEQGDMLLILGAGDIVDFCNYFKN